MVSGSIQSIFLQALVGLPPTGGSSLASPVEDFNSVGEKQSPVDLGDEIRAVLAYKTLGLPTGYWASFGPVAFKDDVPGKLHVVGHGNMEFDGFNVDKLSINLSEKKELIDGQNNLYETSIKYDCLEFDLALEIVDGTEFILEIADARGEKHRIYIPVKTEEIAQYTYLAKLFEIVNNPEFPDITASQVSTVKFGQGEKAKKLPLYHVKLKIPEGVAGNKITKIQFLFPAGSRADLVLDNLAVSGTKQTGMVGRYQPANLADFHNPELSRIAPYAYQTPIGSPLREDTIVRTNLTPLDTLTIGGRGMPLGGVGAIGPTIEPDLSYSIWRNNTGLFLRKYAPYDGFAVYVRQKGKTSTEVLRIPHEQSILSKMAGDYPVGAGTYYGLYPISGFAFDNPNYPVRISTTIFSPFIPGGEEISYPLSVYLFNFYNPTNNPVEVSLMSFFGNMIGWNIERETWGDSSGNYNIVKQDKDALGIIFSNTRVDQRTNLDEMDGQMAIVMPKQNGLTISYTGEFDLRSDGSSLMDQFKVDGVLNNEDREIYGSDTKAYGGALAGKIILSPGQTVLLPLVMVWDQPRFAFGERAAYEKRYTQTFNSQGNNAWVIANLALNRYQKWLEGIHAWQDVILNDPGLPNYYKKAILNEIYIIADGSFYRKDGLIATMECADFQFSHSLDVEWYGQVLLTMFLPEAAKKNDIFVSDLIPKEIKRDGRVVKKPGAVPHDLGTPNLDVLNEQAVNSYSLRDANNWRDLNLKHVISVYRDFYVSGANDIEFLKKNYENLKVAMEYPLQWDTNNDFIPEHDPKVPDQTYDQIGLTGTSAYIGGLALAANKAMVEMARKLGRTEDAALYEKRFKIAQEAFEKNLWLEGQGRYACYYDPSTETRSQNIMADALAGTAAAKLIGLGDLLNPARVKSTLRAVYLNNVLKAGNGKIGAVTMVGPDGNPVPGIQQNEVWVGSNYLLAAYMLSMGMNEEGWHIVESLSDTTYNRGLAYQTPEAWDVGGRVRAPIYTRAKAIGWIEQSRKLKKAG